MSEKKKPTGLVQIYTGEGKGKTTAALGLALRASGQGLKVLFVQFVKGGSLCGEHLFTRKYASFEIVQINNKSSFRQSPEELCLAVEKTMKYSESAVLSGNYDLVVLDELCYAISRDYLPLSRVLDLIHDKPKSVELVLTGRGAPPELIKAADLVTEMIPIKHPFEKGIKSRKGIEY